MCFFLSYRQITHPTHAMLRPLCYGRPRAPRATPPVVTRPCSENSLLNGILKRVSDPSVKMVADTWRPIHNYKEHLEFMKITGSSDEEIDECRRRHEEYYARNPPKKREETAHRLSVKPDSPEWQRLKLVFGDDGKCKLVVDTPFKDILKTNDKEDIMKMYENAGCTEEDLEFLESKFLEYERKMPDRNDYIDGILSKYSGKSSSRAKRKTIRQRFTKKTISILKDIDQVEDQEDTEDTQEDQDEPDEDV